MRRPFANLATALCFLVLGLGFAFLAYESWAGAPDCVRQPASCASFGDFYGGRDRALAFGFAFLFFAMAARVIWNMRHGDPS